MLVMLYNRILYPTNINLGLKYIRTLKEFALLRYWTLALHGTVISAQRGDDEISQTSNNSQLPDSSNNSSNNSSNYRLKPQSNSNNSNNNSGAATNRKTSSQQKASTLSPQASTITRKNGKQKNSNKNGKSNQKTTSSSSMLTTTVRPTYTTVMLNQFSIGTQTNGKNKTKVNQNASTIVPRPRPTARLPNTKSNSNTNNNNNNNNILLSSSKLDKYQPSYSNIYEKSSGKAPKQVKENSYTTPRLSEGPTPNPSISKMFERYDKIEKIFPEFEPYKEVNNPVYFTVSNGKPSRENSKSFSSFVSFDSMPQKKNTPNDDLSQTRQKIVSSSASSASQSTIDGKGTNFLFRSMSWLFFFFCFIASTEHYKNLYFYYFPIFSYFLNRLFSAYEHHSIIIAIFMVIAVFF